MYASIWRKVFSALMSKGVSGVQWTGGRYMKRTLMVGICMVLGMVLVAEARDWGFSKDTVYEWNSGGDTVWLVNSTADALVLNSVIAIDVDTSMWSDTWFNYHP